MTTPPDLLRGIALPNVTAYLGGRGWLHRRDFPRPDVVVFDGPLADDGEPIVAVLPIADQSRDYSARLVELLRTLSILEDRSEREIALDMRRALRTPSGTVERAFVGEIVRLYREVDDDRVAVLRFAEGGRRIQAHVRLDGDDYKIACDAHRDEKQVTVYGRLEQVSAKKWSLLGLRDFGTVDQSTDIEKARMVSAITES